MIKSTLIVVALTTSLAAMAKESRPEFSLHLFEEPQKIDPIAIHSSSGQYLFHNLHRGLLRIDRDGNIVNEGAKCQFARKKVIHCQLKASHKFSDGQRVLAKDYVHGFQRQFHKQRKALANDALLLVKNAKQILKGSLEVPQLGVKALNKHELQIELESMDSDFLYRLAHPSLVPWKSEKLFTGPYKLSNWKKGHSIRLVSNPQYAGHSTRPNVRFYFVQNDLTASRMFDTKQLSFLRRIPAPARKKYEKHPHLFHHQVWRFDYFGFAGESLHKNKSFMQSLNWALDYKQLQKILESSGRPGCVGFPGKLYKTKKSQSPLCQPSDLEKAGNIKVPRNLPPLFIYYSKVNGEDARRWAEWVQFQWKKKLKVNFEVDGVEAGMYRMTLNQKKNSYFRKSLPLDRPTCLAALEAFVSGHNDNFIGHSNKAFDKLVEDLRKATQPSQRRELCNSGLQQLLQTAKLVPAGPMHFSMVHNGSFEGFELNPMGELNLAGLQAVSQ